jgi:tRNA dimethylallyltransferase
LCIQLATQLRTEIISADSRQFFKELKIGAAAPTERQLLAVPHHFVGHLSVSANYNVNAYGEDVLAFLEGFFPKKRFALLTGGSGLYVHAVCHGIDVLPDPDEELRESLRIKLETEGIESLRSELMMLDPVFYDEIDLHNPARLIRAIEVCLQSGRPYSELRSNTSNERPFRILKIGLTRDREELFDRINQRVDLMIEAGLVDEARNLVEFRENPSLKTIGYREIYEHLDGSISLDEAIHKIKANTRHYAKRQMTWFRKDPDMIWFHPDNAQGILETITAFLD